MTHSVSVREMRQMNHFSSAHITHNFEALIEKLYMNGLDPKNVIINLWRNKEILILRNKSVQIRDLKQQTEI